MEEKKRSKILEFLNSKLVILVLIFGLFFITTIFAGDMIFESGNLNVSNVLHIDEDNARVGIGISNPLYNLHVLGDILATHEIRSDNIYAVGNLDVGGNADITGDIIFDRFGSSNVYDSGWVSNSDWTNKDITITHNLGSPLSDLLVKFLVSTDGTDAHSFEIASAADSTTSGADTGIMIYQVSTNSINVQTGEEGIVIVQTNGILTTLDTESYYYKVKIWKLG